MAETTEHILKLQEDAEQLVAALRELHEDAKSYRTAAGELSSSAERLRGLSERTEGILAATCELVKGTADAGIGGIIERLDGVGESAVDTATKLSELQAGLDERHARMADALNALGNAVEENLASTGKRHSALHEKLDGVERLTSSSSEANQKSHSTTQEKIEAVNVRTEQLERKARIAIAALGIGLAAMVILQVVQMVVK